MDTNSTSRPAATPATPECVCGASSARCGTGRFTSASRAEIAGAGQLLNNVEFDLRHALSDDSERFGGGMRDVDDASGNKRATVIDPNRHGLPGGDVGDAQPCAERQRTVRGRQFARIETLAVRGSRSLPVEARKSMRAFFCLGCGLVGPQWSMFLRGDGPVRDN